MEILSLNYGINLAQTIYELFFPLRFMKLAQMGIVQVIGNIKDEKTFFTLTSMKSKLQN